MANTATSKPALAIKVWGCPSVTPVEIILDTAATDLTVYTPASGQMCGIIGMNYAETNAHTLTFTSGSDQEFAFELGANSGISQGITRELLFVTQPGSALKVQTSAAISSPIILYIIEGPEFVIAR